jgi:hypothetical protein
MVRFLLEVSWERKAEAKLVNNRDGSIVRSLAPLAAALVMAGIVLFVPALLNDGDTYWHIATGEWVLTHGRVPAQDIFSHSRPGAPWIAHEWLSDVLMASAIRVGGWSGLLAMFAVSVGGAAWLLTNHLSRRLGGLTLIALTVLSLACMSGSLLARPQLFMLPMLIVWTIEMMAARDAGRAPRLVFALMMLLWANLHGSYVIAFVVAGAFGLEALFEKGADRVAVLRSWGVFGLVCLACVFMTPHGLSGLLYPFQIMGMAILPYIDEWRAEDFSHPSAFAITLFFTLFVCLSRGVKIPVFRLLLLLGLVFMSFQHVRHQFVLAALAPLILAAPLAETLGHSPIRVRPGRKSLLAFGVICLALLTVRLAMPVQRVDNITSPVTALTHVPADLTARPVLNGYGFGGYLISKGVRPFIDGRSDMYGDAFTTAYLKAVSPDPAAFAKLTRDYRIAWTIFSPTDSVVSLLDKDPEWRRLYADQYAVVHQRVSPPPPAGG